MSQPRTLGCVPPNLSALPCHKANLLDRPPQEQLEQQLHRYFEQQVVCTPDLPAIVDFEQTLASSCSSSSSTTFSLTYRQVNLIANHLAAQLIFDHSVLENDIVGLFLDRSSAFLIAYIAVNKARAAYMPLELSYPEKLLRSVFSRTEPSLVLTRRQFMHQLPSGEHAVNTLCLPPTPKLLEQIECELGSHQLDALSLLSIEAFVRATRPDAPRIDLPASAENALFVVMSSGSTGLPKAIISPHRSSISSYVWRHNAISQYQPGMRVAAGVFFVWECFRPLMYGSTVYPIPDHVLYDPPALVQFLCDAQIDEVLFTPSLFETVLNVCDHQTLHALSNSLSTIWLNGEVVTVVLRSRALDAFPRTKIFNLYSTSEAHDTCAIDLTDDNVVALSEKFCPAGHISNLMDCCSLYLLDDQKRPITKAGGAGELYIGGAGIATGYLKQPETTRERFIKMDSSLFHGTNMSLAASSSSSDDQIVVSSPSSSPNSSPSHSPPSHSSPPHSSPLFTQEIGENESALLKHNLYATRKTARCFPDCPQVLYKTGDRARILANGYIEILGRCDYMVKIRGYSVQLGAVEATILKHIQVKTCIVLAVGDEGEDKRLVAYLVATDDNDDAGERLSSFNIDSTTGACLAIRKRLMQYLPFYMVPSIFRTVNKIPLLASGKLDRRALLKACPPPSTTSDCAIASSSSCAQQKTVNMRRVEDICASILHRQSNNLIVTTITAIWNSLLHLPDENVLAETDDFFHLGGHSLACARLLTMIKQCFGGVTITMKELFAHRTLGGLVDLVRNKINNNTNNNNFITNTTNITNNNMTNLTNNNMTNLTNNNMTNLTNNNNIINKSTNTPKNTLRALINKDLCMLTDFQHTTQHQPVLPIDKANAILLTGSTGFLGAFVLCELIDQTNAIIHCLVRPQDNRTCQDRVIANLRRYMLLGGVGSSLSLDQLYARIEFVEGSVSSPKFGLDDVKYAHLVSTIDSIVHCAAAVNLFLPYAQMRATNVLGTKHLIDMALQRMIPLHYVSTNGAFPNHSESFVLEDEESLDQVDPVDDLSSGYSQSKWVGEKLLWQAHRQYHLPVSIFRPGNLSGSSANGAANFNDFNYLMLRSLCMLGTYPTLSRWDVEMTPVNFAAAAMVSILRTNAWQTDTVYNLVNPNHIDAQFIVHWLISAGYQHLKGVTPETWLRMLHDQCGLHHSDTDLSAFASLLDGDLQLEQTLSASSDFDTSKFERALCTFNRQHRQCVSPCRRPAIRFDLLNKYLSYFTSQGSFPTPSVAMMQASGTHKQSLTQSDGDTSVTSSTSTTSSSSQAASSSAGDQATSMTTSEKQPIASQLPLFDRVAIVTGASSGIGTGIARALVEAGARVVLAARSEDALHKVQQHIGTLPGVKVLFGGQDVSESRLSVYRTDVTVRSDMDALIAHAEQRFSKPVDIFVNNAGVMYFTLMKNVQLEEWDRTVSVNVNGLVNGVGAVLPSMLKNKTGHIVTITSDAGRVVFPGLSVYSASKFFQEALCKGLRLETASSGIRVSCIQPGNVETPLLAKSTDQEALKIYGTPTGAKILSPADIGKAVVYIVSQPENVAVNEVLIEPREEPA